MATSKGRSEVKRYIGGLPAQLAKILRGAGRAGANVIAEEARDRVTSQAVREKISVATKAEDGRIVAKVQVKMGGYNLPLWLEYGTGPHFISVDNSQRGGMSVRRINDKEKAGSLVINGSFVGDTVKHPGARAHPFMRPALDVKETEARNAAQSYVNSRIKRAGIAADGGGDDL